MHADEFHILMEVPCRFPSRFRMAFRALRSIAAIVRIFVTSRTVLLRQLGEVISPFEVSFALSEAFLRRRVAFRALHLLMLPFDFKIGLIMVKGLARAEGLRRMTAQTGFLRELRIEHILVFVHVTVLTVAFLLARENKLLPVFRRLGRQDDVLRRLMAFHAFRGEFLVAAGQLEVGLIVIEVIDPIKALLRRMAARARALEVLLFELFLMNAHMAVRTEIRVVSAAKFKQVSGLGDLKRRQGLLRRQVTLPAAIHRPVLADQFEARRIMIKGQP